MSFTALSPTSHTSVEQKLKARNCALQLKNGSPKLRDLLRERCRLRMKESRADSFSTSRQLPIEGKRLIMTIVNEEMADEINSNIELQEIILEEIYDKWEQWQNEEFEKSMEWMMSSEDETQVFCPVCERNLLTLQENIISCKCGVRLYYPKTLPEFYENMQSNVKAHELQNCHDKLQFFAEAKVGFNVLALNAICHTCDFYAPILQLI